MSAAKKEPRRVGTLEIEQDLREQERIWKIQRWGRTILVFFLLAGLLGVFGGSWLGRADTRDPSGRLRVAHPRLARVQAPFELRLEVSGDLAPAGELSVWFDSALLRGLSISAISPQPSEEAVGAERIVYRFRVTDAAGAMIPIVFHATTQSVGAAGGRIGVTGGPELAVGHFIFP